MNTSVEMFRTLSELQKKEETAIEILSSIRYRKRKRTRTRTRNQKKEISNQVKTWNITYDMKKETTPMVPKYWNRRPVCTYKKFNKFKREKFTIKPNNSVTVDVNITKDMKTPKFAKDILKEESNKLWDHNEREISDPVNEYSYYFDILTPFIYTNVIMPTTL